MADLDTGLVQVGSGYLIAERLVLTALHCTVDKRTGREARSLRVVRRTDGAEASATRIAAALDVAVLSLREGPEWIMEKALEPPLFGRVGRDHAGELLGCEAVGFPLWQMNPQGLQRNAAELHGTIRVTEDVESGVLVMRDALLRDVDVPNAASGKKVDERLWGGLSGALVFYQGVALGIVIEHHPRQGRSALRIMPIERVAAVSSIDANAAAVASVLGLVSADELLLVSSSSQYSGVPISGEVWRVPFPVDPDFVGRDEEMAALSAGLAPGTRTVVTQAIAGLGGIGKTQLAAHVAHAVGSRFHIIWWIEAEHRAAIDASLRSLGKAMHLSEDPSSVEVLAELSSLGPHINWMLIYDNVESPASLQGMLPTRGSGVVLITTRYQDWPAWASVIDLGPLSKAAAVRLLSKGATDDPDTAQRIADMFGRLPLALAQAAAQIRAGMSLEQYEELLRSRFVDALGSRASLPDYDRSVLDVIVIARDAAAAAAIGAQRLLILLALLDPDRIDDWLLQGIPEGDPLADPLIRTGALAALKRFSLVTEVQGESRAYAVHRLVQEVIRRTSEGEQADITELALQILVNAITQKNQKNRDQRTFRIVRHLQSFLDIAERYHPRKTVGVLNFLASYAGHGFARDHTSAWATRAALGIVEKSPGFSEDDLVAALLRVHRADSNNMRHRRHRPDTTEIRRALALQRKRDTQGSLTVASMQLELARTLGKKHYWWVEFGFNEDDLAEASTLTESAMSMLQGERERAALASARALHAGIIGHLRQVDDAVAEYYEAVNLAEADGSVWLGRADAAHALLKFGRVSDARKVIYPVLDRLDDDSEDAFMRHVARDTFDRVYPICLWEQQDWREYIRYAEMKRDARIRRRGESEVRRNTIDEYYFLQSMRTGYKGLEWEDKIDETEKQLELTAIAHVTESLARTPTEATDRLPGAEEIVVMLERVPDDRSLPVGTDWLYGLPVFDNRPDLKIRIARAERIARERAAEQRSRSGSETVAVDLVVYALMREARELAESDWDAAVSTFERARSLIDSGEARISRSERARACIDMVSAMRPGASIYAQEAVNLLTGEPGYDSTHHVGFSCTMPALLLRAADRIAALSKDYETARSLEFSAAALEEKVHDRIFPTVSRHLFNAAWYSRRSGDSLTSSMGVVPLLEESLDIAAICFGDDSPRWAGRATELAAAVRDTNRPRARTLLLRAAKIFSDFYGVGHSSLRECETNLAELDSHRQR